MEGIRNAENESRENFFDSREDKNSIEDLVKEYIFTKEAGKKISLSVLAKAEGHSAAFDVGSRMVENESKLCNCKKGLEQELLGKKPDEIALYWKEAKGEYRKSFIEELENTKKKFPRSRRKEKRTLLGEDEIRPGQKAEKSFAELEKGIMREITINKILNTIQDIKAEIASSELDVNNKIDIIAYSNKSAEADKIIIAVQIKGDNGEHNSKDSEVIEEIHDNAKGKKLEFYNGSENFKNMLKNKSSNIEVVKIWITIPDSDIINEGEGYKNELKIDIESGLKEILKNYKT